MRPPRHRLPTFRIHGIRHLGVQREEIERRKVETIKGLHTTELEMEGEDQCVP
jgi:hypothetical protein